MNRLKIAIAAALMTLPLLSCAGYNAYQRARTAERTRNWDDAVDEYQKALEIDPDNAQFKMSLLRARLESSRMHFEKGKSLRHAAVTAGQAGDQLRLAQLAATELEITVKLDPTNQFAADEMQKAVQLVNDLQHSNDHNSIDEIKKRAKNNVTKTQPPQLNPASDAPISLSFPHETPVKDIYRALGNAFGINILFDQAVKDDKISIELKDVTAQQALERVMQAGNHFYKVLDEHTIIVVPDNPQARRDYEDLVIRTFYLSNGDAEQVTNVVRTMIEARNVFPLKALNAITIRDTADKVRIAEKIIEANDKAKAEVVVDVELLQLDLDKSRDLGAAIAGFSSAAPGVLGPFTTDSAGVATPLASATLDQLRGLTRGNFSFSIPSASYAALKSVSNSQLLANPELRISEGEKATLHIGSRIPVPVSTFNSITAGTTGGTVAPVTSFQYQDVGIKVSMEPRVHHNREVTLKLTVEVSNQGPSVSGGDGQPPQPTFATRTIESTIRLKDGETNFLAGLIQETDENSDTKTPLIGEIPIIGRLFTQNHKHTIRTDLVMTMTPHIIRMPDITEDDVAPMWVGTSNNLTFRGVSPRIESQSGTDPFTQPATGRTPNAQFGTPDPDARMTSQGEPVNVGRPAPASGTAVPTPSPVQGSAPSDPFSSKPDTSTPQPQSQPEASNSSRTSSLIAEATSVTDIAALRLSPRIGAQPSRIALKPGEERLWSVVGMDLDGLTTNEILLHYDPMALEVSDISLGAALSIDVKQPPTTKIDSTAGTIRISSTDGKPLTFTGGGNLATLRVHGGMTGSSMLIVDDPNLKNARGELVQSAIAGGRAQVQ